MKSVVKKPFGWYPNGHTREALVIGDERDFGDATDGLTAEGLIAPAAGKFDVETVSVVEMVIEEPVVEEPVAEEPAVEAPAVDESVEEQAEEAPAEEVETKQPKRRGRPRK